MTSIKIKEHVIERAIERNKRSLKDRSKQNETTKTMIDNTN